MPKLHATTQRSIIEFCSQYFFLVSLQIVDAISQDANCVKHNIPQSLAEVACILEGEDGADC